MLIMIMTFQTLESLYFDFFRNSHEFVHFLEWVWPINNYLECLENLEEGKSLFSDVNSVWRQKRDSWYIY